MGSLGAEVSERQWNYISQVLISNGSFMISLSCEASEAAKTGLSDLKPMSWANFPMTDCAHRQSSDDTKPNS